MSRRDAASENRGAGPVSPQLVIVLAVLLGLTRGTGRAANAACGEWTEDAGPMFSRDGRYCASLDRDRALITHDGSAYLLEREGGEWREVDEIAAASDEVSFYGGILDGDRALVLGSTALPRRPGRDDVFLIFDRTEVGWVPVVRFIPNELLEWREVWPVALDGDRALIAGKHGSWQHVHVFELRDGEWQVTAAIGPMASGDLSLALEGERILIGHPTLVDCCSPPGKAFVAELSGEKWSITATLDAPVISAGFGASVDLDGDRALIGSPTVGSVDFRAGSAHLFELQDDWWAAVAELTASEPVSSFGASVSLDGDRALVGALHVDDGGSPAVSAAHVFELRGDGWSACGTLAGSESAGDEILGARVALDDDHALVDNRFHSTSASEVRPLFRRGDTNADGELNLSDAVFLLNGLFLGGAQPRCRAASDVNGDAAVNLSDAVSVLNHLFLGGPGPVAPFPECGPGMPADYERLGCESAPDHCK